MREIPCPCRRFGSYCRQACRAGTATCCEPCATRLPDRDGKGEVVRFVRDYLRVYEQATAADIIGTAPPRISGQRIYECLSKLEHDGRLLVVGKRPSRTWKDAKVYMLVPGDGRG